MSNGTWEQRLGRLLAGAGAVFGVVYLGWRTAFSVAGVPGWLAVPALAVEIVGVVASVLLVWALWREPASAGAAPADPVRDQDEEIDVVVRCSGQAASALRATLLSTTRADGRMVLDLTGDPSLRALAARHGARYLAVPAGDLDGLGAAAQVLERPQWLVLDAGDVVAPSAFDRLRAAMDDPRVAVVIAPAVTIERDAGFGSRPSDDFERRSLRPALGARGFAIFQGSGALIRAAAVADRSFGTASPEMVGAELTTELLAEGWYVVAPAGEPVLGVAAIAAPEDAEVRHAAEASAARRLLTGRHGALARGRFTPQRRLALLTQAIRPLSGVHRGWFMVVVLAALLDGRLPFRPDATALLLTWLPWFLLTPLGLGLLSGWTLRPGDRASWSMRLLGPSWRGVLTPNGRPDRPRLALAGAFGVRHGAGLSGAVALLSIVVGLRGLSDRVTHTLEPMARPEAAGLLAVAMWTLAMGLDGLHLFARPERGRRSTRVAAAIPGTVSGRTAVIVDLTPEGAAVLSDSEVAVGTACAIDVVLPTTSGCVTAILPAVVRNHGLDAVGVHRLGVEFFDVEPVAQQALVEYCLVEPVLARLDHRPLRPSEIDLAGDDPSVDVPRRMGLRAAALIAVAGAVASAVPSAPSSAASSSDPDGLIGQSGRVIAAGVGAEVSWLVTLSCAAIAVGLVGGLRPARLRVPVRPARRPSRRGR